MLNHMLLDKKSFAFAHRIHIHFGTILRISFVPEMQIFLFRRWYPIGIDVYGLLLCKREIEMSENVKRLW